VLNPILKLLFNPNPIIQALHAQVDINKHNLEREEAQEKRRLEMEPLYFEIIHNLVFEMTRTGIEVKNLKMRVESLSSRLEFIERRARALESVVAYKPAADDREEPPARQAGPDRGDVIPAPPVLSPATSSQPSPAAPSQPAPGGAPEGPGQRARRRRRRRGRRSGAPASAIMGAAHDHRADETGDGERPETIEQAIAAEAHPSEPPAPNAPPAEAHTRSEQASLTEPPGDTPGSGPGDPSTLGKPQGHPEPSDGTTSSGSPGATSRDDDQQ
jgi:hypothetical protein